MAFSIQTTDELFDETACGEPALRGLIEIGDFKEDLLLSLLIWTRVDYEKQWEDGLRQILAATSSCLITSMRDLAVSDFINRWLLYREGEKVVFQNQVLLASDLRSQVTGGEFWRSIPERKTHTEGDREISEWFASLGDIRAFLATAGKRG